MSREKKGIVYASIGFFIMAGLLLLHVLLPRNIVSLIGVDNISWCYMLMDRSSSVSGDLIEADLDHFLQILRETDVQLCGPNRSMETSSKDGKRYRLYFSNEAKQFAELNITESNRIFFNGNEYKILGGNQPDIVSFLTARFESSGQ